MAWPLAQAQLDLISGPVQGFVLVASRGAASTVSTARQNIYASPQPCLHRQRKQLHLVCFGNQDVWVCLGLSPGSLKDSHRCDAVNAFLTRTISSTFRAILGFFGRTRSEINSGWPNPSKDCQALQIAGQHTPRDPEINSRRPDPTRALKKSEIKFQA